MRKTMKSLAFLGVVLGLVTVAVTSHALALGDHRTFLTFNRPVGLPGVALGTGTYIFELAEPNSNNSIVRVLSADRQRVYLTAFTYPIMRPANMRRDQVVTFGESTNGAPTPITAWFPEGANTGREFIYRK
ncbi:MAG TPA: hypothetical protein VH497_04765 [Vicinamibacterales bacterium]|jgi:hypothetical protein